MIINRTENGKFELPADGWYHIAPLGEFVGTRELAEGKEERVTQLVDAAALAAIVNRFERNAASPNFPGILVDYDHFSHDTEKSSEAAGWVEKLQNRDDGLWAQIRWSDKGEEAVRGGRYRLISPVWDGPTIANGRVRPEVLLNLGLTNDPNLRGMVPLSNRQQPATQPKPQTERHMIKLIALLGLAEGTSEDVAAVELGKVLNRARQFDELKPIHDALLDSQAEADLDAHGITDPAIRSEIKPGIIANRTQALAFLKLSKPTEKKAAPAPIHNRAGAKTPSTDLTDAAASSAGEQQAFVETIRVKNRCSFREAWNIARSEKPELFTTTKN